MPKQNFFKEMADLFLESDKIHVDWIKEPELKTAFYFLFGSIISPIILKLGLMAFAKPLEASETFSFYYRTTQLITLTLFLLALFVLTIKYYNFMVKGKYKVYFSNIILFYILSVAIFAFCYLTLYKMDSDYFSHEANTYNYGKVIKYSDFNIKTSAQFVLYSLFQSVNTGMKQLTSNSILVSVYNYLQNIYTIGLLSLLVATFVNRRTTDE